MSTIIAQTEKQLIKYLIGFKSLTIYSSFNKNHFSTTHSLNKQEIDFSKVPIINEKDLREQFVHGSGPGGQNVNKLSNCVVLKHLPTGIVVKCHSDRLLHKNRVIARQLLQTKLDEFINGSESVTAQKQRYLNSKSFYKDKKATKLRDLKKEFKLRQDSEVKEVENDVHVEGNH